MSHKESSVDGLGMKKDVLERRKAELAPEE